MLEKVSNKFHQLQADALIRTRKILKEEKGQGTTEYAILVGVLVVIAIVAIVAFKDRVQELWTAIADEINSL